jgi:hypothetical protein
MNWRQPRLHHRSKLLGFLLIFATCSPLIDA